MNELNMNEVFENVKNIFSDNYGVSTNNHIIYISAYKHQIVDKTFTLVNLVDIFRAFWKAFNNIYKFKMGIQYGDEGGEYYGYGTLNFLENDGIHFLADGDVEGATVMNVADFCAKSEEFDDTNTDVWIKNMDEGGDYFGYRDCTYIGIDLNNEKVVLA